MKIEKKEFIYLFIYFMTFYSFGESLYLITAPLFFAFLVYKKWKDSKNNFLYLYIIHAIIFLIKIDFEYFYKIFIEVFYLGFSYLITLKVTYLKKELKDEICGEKYKDLVENIDAFISILDLKGEIKYINSNFEKKMGIKKNEVITSNIKDLILKEDQGKIENSFENLIKKGKETIEFRIEDKERKIRYIKAIFRIVINEKNIEIFALMEDRTELKEKEDQLIQMYQALEQSSSMVVIADKNAKITYANPKYYASLKCLEKDLIGKNIFQFGKNKENEEIYSMIEENFKYEKAWKGDVLLNNQKNEEYWEHISFSVIKNDNGENLGYIKISDDITDSKNIEKKMIEMKRRSERLNSAKSEFLADMSHEIRTPLNGIIGFTEFLVELEQDKEKLEILDMIKHSGISLLSLINYIMDITKIELGKMELENSAFDFEDLLEKQIRNFDYLIKDKELEVKSFFKDKVGKVYGDRLRIEQIFSNLISNAVKFTESGQIKIRVEKLKETSKKTRLYFEVSDTGIGISKEKVDKIFDKFEQAEGDTFKRFGGTGLGLAIVKNLVKMMGGEISVRSKIDRGSIFKFDLVLAKVGEKDEPREIEKKATNIKKTKGLNVIIAEDNKVNQKLVLKLLEGFEWKIHLAGTGTEVLKIMEENQIDFILMDIQMPEMDGIEAMKQIRRNEHDKRKKTMILVNTAYAMKGDEEELIRLGADGYISKPISKNRLYKKIFGMIEKEDKNEKSI